MRVRGRWAVAAVLAAAVSGWPTPASAGTSGTTPVRPGEPGSNGRACAAGADRPSVPTRTPVLAVRQSAPGGGQNLTTTFAWWPIDGTSGGAGQASRSAGNPALVAVEVPEGLLADGGTYAWRARTFDGTRHGPWSGRCEFAVDATAPQPPAGVTSTDYPADAPAGGVGVPGRFVISPPELRPDEVVAYAWTLDSGVGPAGAATVPADAGTQGATLTIAPSRDGILTLRVWSKDRAGLFSTPVTWTFRVKAAGNPQPARPLTPTISFPDGNTVEQGGTLSVRLDAEGDKSVTQFRYSVGAPTLNLTAAPNEPGGYAVVQVPVGNVPGSRSVYAVASDGAIDSLLTAAGIQVRNLTLLNGRVLDITTFLPVPDATVRLEPGGFQTTTNAEGEFSFLTSEVPPGLYTVITSHGGCSREEGPYEVDGQGLTIDLLLVPDQCGQATNG
ncbi:carboxypeptidase-like regulatory domain-containing protein [Paractinoplanes hotanensis]|uniref:Carboxypeptidase-like regulatory domain-containing protein n=1 Tax=Paractinoplanes hotanensis TaxID=2906497 RepID=A0ABT0XRX8_9ACTN|nr:carboxypeptidase-like regulatory domain-containing protein [Actinoplanes hotanensis]MCM4076008.1 carboxypeptidase-like regulatory domain-containing protein [Actinoplanes hotanensis]